MQKNSKKVILSFMFLIQIVWWTIFTISNEALARIHWEQRTNHFILQSMQYLSLIIIPILVFIIYLINEKKLKEKLQLKPFKYDTLIIGSWIFITIITLILIVKIGGNYIGYCNPNLEGSSGFIGPCFLSGIEYSIMAFIMILPAIILTILKIIILIYRIITGKIKIKDIIIDLRKSQNRV